MAAPERDSAFSGTSTSESSESSEEDATYFAHRGSDGEGGGVNNTISEGSWNGHSAADSREKAWSWVVHQDGSTGKVRSYRIMADGRVPQNLREVQVAVGFLAAYLDRSVPDRARFARIQRSVVPGMLLRTMHDPLFLHPPARKLTGIATGGAAGTTRSGATTEAIVRLVLVGTDIGNYRVSLVRGRAADAEWRVRSVLPPDSWLQ